MSRELMWLTLTVILTGLLWVPYIIDRCVVRGLMGATAMPLINAIGSSLVSVTAFGLTTAVSYAWSGLIDWPLAGLFIVGGALGGLFGTKLAHYLTGYKHALTLTFSGIVIAVGLYVVAKSIWP